MLYGLLDFDPDSQPSLEQWVLWHKADHDAIRKAIQSATGQNLTDWNLYPLRMANWDLWSEHHQQTHNDMNNASGLVGNDLTDVDFKDVEARAQWNFNHFREHQAISQKYGI